ncbi:MAG TPA: flagellar assembly peptidoglycan hydrolase FlgJ [Betaproteobacteria bacterium]|nr:flagellar assembly peptidoglycan hydrolase FlgJ [Betaproteobacteria bacterium]
MADRLALNVQSLGALRLAAKQKPQQALKAVAQQFESLFLNMMLKSMRATVPSDSLMDNNQSRLYMSLLDQQLAEKMASGPGLGIADLLSKQFSREGGAGGKVSDQQPVSAPVAGISLPGRAGIALPGRQAPTPPAVSAATASEAQPASSPQHFVNRLWPHAAQAARDLGVPPHFLLAQAALESGWGRHEIHRPDGGPSYNLFGIKAGPDWHGAVAYATTTEYVNGKPTTRREPFRAYTSYAEGFRDYARLLKNNPRYAPALAGGADAAVFAKGLQRAGYATDPMYADKLTRVIHSQAMREALAS